jgi:hypothetical protein
MSLPRPMREVIRLADELPDEALLAMAAELKREWVSQAALREMFEWVRSSPAIAAWNEELLKYLGTWVEKRFGALESWVKPEDGSKALEMHVRPVFQGACLAAVAYAADAISVETYREACRPWVAGQAVTA